MIMIKMMVMIIELSATETKAILEFALICVLSDYDADDDDEEEREREREKIRKERQDRRVFECGRSTSGCEWIHSVSTC
jgi:hypothetical protein